MINRDLYNVVEQKRNDNKVIVLLGARQVGKTTLLEDIIKTYKNVLHFTGDDSDTRNLLKDASSAKLRNIIGNADCIFIDEAQRIENIGLCLKIIHDNKFPCKVFASGSSSFDLANKINEPLTGRKWEYQLFPLSYGEMIRHTSYFDEHRNLEHRLIYGYYPDVINNPGNEKNILNQLANSYLYKDIFSWQKIQKPDKLEKLVQALAFQVGNLVSYNELGQITGLNNETVEHYISMLEKAFIVFRLGTFNRNLRDELKKTRKIYFYDNGIRNAVIKQYMPLDMRNDKGALWENFLMAERMKHNHYSHNYCNTYFWRNLAQQEIDYIEEKNGQIEAYEFKWRIKKSTKKFPSKFIEAYKPKKTQVIDQENYQEFLLGDF